MDNKVVRTDARDWPDFAYQIEDTYRGDGKRHVENHFAGASGWGGLTTAYHYDAGFDVLTEEHGGVVKTMVGGLGEAIGTSSSLGTYRYFTHDHLGSVREVRDESAGLTAEFAYGPYEISSAPNGHLRHLALVLVIVIVDEYQSFRETAYP